MEKLGGRIHMLHRNNQISLYGESKIFGNYSADINIYFKVIVTIDHIIILSKYWYYRGYFYKIYFL